MEAVKKRIQEAIDDNFESWITIYYKGIELPILPKRESN